jgi:hypothetical protein
MDWERSNIEIIKNKVNDCYRDSRFRNNETRLSFNNYCSMHSAFNSKLAVENYKNPHLNAIGGYIFELLVEKNGFTSINVVSCDRNTFRFDSQRNIISKDRMISSRYEERSGSKLNNGDYLINSLRVLKNS